MLQKNPFKVEFIRNNRHFSFVVAHIKNTKTNTDDFEFVEKTEQKMELDDLAKHLKIPVMNAKKIVLDTAKLQFKESKIHKGRQMHRVTR